MWYSERTVISMKHYLKLFALVEVLLFSYIFSNSIYQIYEKNNITSKNMSYYAITNSEAEKLADFYNEIVKNIDGYQFEQVVNTVSETNNTEYELYCLPFDSFSKKQPVTSSIHFNYKELKQDDFVDSTGLFYTDIPFEKLNKIAKNSDLTVKAATQYKISYSMFFSFYALDFIVLFIVLQIVYGIYTSYNLKKIGIKKSMGFSKSRILKEQIGNVLIYLSVIEAVFLLFMSLYYALSNRLSLSFIVFILFYFIGVNLLNTICILNTSVLTKLVNIESMIKNKSVNKAMNFTAQIIKIIFVLLISVCVSRVLVQAGSYKNEQKNILNYKMLNDYYTANGFYSDKYNEVYNSKEQLKKYSANMKMLYNENQSLMCDSSALDLIKIEGIGNKLAEYEINKIFSNKAYVDKFGKISVDGKPVEVDSGKYIVLVAEKYKDREDEVKECISAELYNMKNYNRNYEIIDSIDKDIDYDMIYVDDTSSIMCNTSNGFEEINIGLLFIDNGESGGMLYLDMLNSGYIFFKLDSREIFKSMLVKYSLDDLVSAGTLLTPYYQRLENVEFVLKTLMIFSAVFIISLIFIIYISGYIDIIANKAIYSTKEVLGFSHFSILRNRCIIILIECLVILSLGYIYPFALWALCIVVIDYIIHETLYRMYVKRKLYENVKGA